MKSQFGDIPQLKKKLEWMEHEVIESDFNLDYLENQFGRNNVRLNGIPEIPNEIWEMTEKAVKN